MVQEIVGTESVHHDAEFIVDNGRFNDVLLVYSVPLSVYLQFEAVHAVVPVFVVPVCVPHVEFVLIVIFL